MFQLPSMVDMLKAGVHFGHQRSRWHPKMEPYLFGVRNGTHIINLEETLVELEKTLTHVKSLAAEGKMILFVGTKHQARDIVKEAATRANMPFLVERWIGGLLTNFDEVKRRLKKYAELKELVKSGEVERYTKKEQVHIKKQIEKMDKYLIGLTGLTQIPEALFVVDMRIEKTAVTEAERMGVPVIAMCDSNVNPTKASYIIPANDDAVSSIKLMVNLMADAVMSGRMEYDKKQAGKVIEKAAAAKSATPTRAMVKEESM